MLQKIITTQLCNELACGPGLPRTAQHSITTVLLGKTIVQTLGKTTVQTQVKTTVETLGKTTVAKWRTGRATLIEPY